MLSTWSETLRPVEYWKNRMKREGLLRRRMRKWGVFEDVVWMAILRDDWAKPDRLSR